VALTWLAAYPWQAVTWFGRGQSVRWHDQAASFPLGAEYEGVLLLEDPSGIAGPDAPDLTGFTVGGDSVRWLWVIPISERSRQLARERGSASLIRRLAVEGRSCIAGSG
jgi:hypothetical protein